jgi:hypothetical protein
VGGGGACTQERVEEPRAWTEEEKSDKHEEIWEEAPARAGEKRRASQRT